MSKHEQLYQCIQCDDYDGRESYCHYHGGCSMKPKSLKYCQGFSQKKEASDR